MGNGQFLVMRLPGKKWLTKDGFAKSEADDYEGRESMNEPTLCNSSLDKDCPQVLQSVVLTRRTQNNRVSWVGALRAKGMPS